MENERDLKKCVIRSIRVCLIIHTFVRLILDLVAIAYLGYFLLILIALSQGAENFLQLALTLLMLVIEIMLIVDVGFSLAMLKGLFKQSFSILRVMYCYEMYAIAALMLMIPVTFCVLYASDLLFKSVAKCVCLGIAGFLVVLIEVFVILGVKSQMIVFRDKKLPETVRLRRKL